MGFAGPWLEKRALFPALINEDPDQDAGIIVVVPAFDEPGITDLLDSLSDCEKPECTVEVLVIVNAPQSAGKESLINNQLSLKKMKDWKERHKNCFFRLSLFDAGQPAFDGWGAGLARKVGMDEALRRFSIIDRKDGVIVSLDADCRVRGDYFTEIFRFFSGNKRNRACSVYFEHPVSGDEFSNKIYKYIVLYELHLRYYVQALKYSGFPYAFHTVGSAIAFRAEQYMKAGGMNRRQAGEDFYLIQKLVMQEGYFNLNTTVVYPSPRESLRVPFGTGPSMSKLIAGGNNSYKTYNLRSFIELRKFFDLLKPIFKMNGTEATALYSSLPGAFKSFIEPEEWSEKIAEIKMNTSTRDSFRKRFFVWFNMFRVVKYLNHAHMDIFEKQDVTEAAASLLTLTGQPCNSDDPMDLLRIYRNLDKISH